jgi:5'-deoxynucleotidase YfbR-like HD superfamily hydrolase
MIAKTLGADRDVQGQVALFGTLHDLAECVTGDVVRPFKYSSQEFKEAVDRAEASMIGELPPEVSSLMSDMDEIRSEYIRAIVKAADWLSVYQYMRREASRGNLEIIPFFMRMVKDLESAVKENEGKKVSLHAGADDFIPANFYHTLWSHALLVADDCFGDLAKPESRWMREV